MALQQEKWADIMGRSPIMKGPEARKWARNKLKK